MHKPVLSLDFDGVIHSYKAPWQGATVIPDPPLEGAFDFIRMALEVFDVHIHSSRCNHVDGIDAMQRWFLRWGLEEKTRMQLVYAVQKPPAFVTLDDRAVTFTGEFPDPKRLLEFKPWNQNSR